MTTNRNIGTFFVNGDDVLNANLDNKTLLIPPIESLIAEIEAEYIKYLKSLVPYFPHRNTTVINTIISALDRLENGGLAANGISYTTFSTLSRTLTILTTSELQYIEQLTGFTEVNYATVPFPEDKITYFEDKLAVYSNLKVILSDPDTRYNYFNSSNGSSIFTIGEKSYDSFVISNNYNLEDFLFNIDNKIAEVNLAITNIQNKSNVAVNNYNVSSLNLRDKFLDFIRMIYNFKDSNNVTFTSAKKLKISNYFNGISTSGEETFIDLEGNPNDKTLFTDRFKSLANSTTNGYYGLIAKFETVITNAKNNILSVLNTYNNDSNKNITLYNGVGYDYRYRWVDLEPIINANERNLSPWIFCIEDMIRNNNVDFVKTITGGNGGGSTYSTTVDNSNMYSATVLVPPTHTWGTGGYKAYYGIIAGNNGDIISRGMLGFSYTIFNTVGAWITPMTGFPLPYLMSISYNKTTNKSMSEYVVDPTYNPGTKLPLNLLHKLNLIYQILNKSTDVANNRLYSSNDMLESINNYNRGVYGICKVDDLLTSYGNQLFERACRYYNYYGTTRPYWSNYVRWRPLQSYLDGIADKDHDVSVLFDDYK